MFPIKLYNPFSSKNREGSAKRIVAYPAAYRDYVWRRGLKELVHDLPKRRSCTDRTVSVHLSGVSGVVAQETQGRVASAQEDLSVSGIQEISPVDLIAARRAVSVVLTAFENTAGETGTVFVGELFAEIVRLQADFFHRADGLESLVSLVRAYPEFQAIFREILERILIDRPALLVLASAMWERHS